MTDTDTEFDRDMAYLRHLAARIYTIAEALPPPMWESDFADWYYQWRVLQFAADGEGVPTFSIEGEWPENEIEQLLDQWNFEISDWGWENIGPWMPFNKDGSLRDLEAEGWHHIGAMKDD